jgi:hypothetical protein
MSKKNDKAAGKSPEATVNVVLPELGAGATMIYGFPTTGKTTAMALWPTHKRFDTDFMMVLPDAPAALWVKERLYSEGNAQLLKGVTGPIYDRISKRMQPWRNNTNRVSAYGSAMAVNAWLSSKDSAAGCAVFTNLTSPRFWATVDWSKFTSIFLFYRASAAVVKDLNPNLPNVDMIQGWIDGSWGNHKQFIQGILAATGLPVAHWMLNENEYMSQVLAQFFRDFGSMVGHPTAEQVHGMVADFGITAIEVADIQSICFNIPVLKRFFAGEGNVTNEG